MSLSLLSNFQLYEIVQNEKLDKAIRKDANTEFDSRNISEEELKAIIAQHNSLFKQENQAGLHIRYKLLLIVFPFFILIHNIIASLLLDKGHKRKWKEYWQFVGIGFFIWTIVFLLYARFVLFAEYGRT